MVDFSKFAAHVPGVMYQFCQRADGRFTLPFASPGLAEIYGVDPESVRDDAARLFEHIHPQDLSGVLESIRESGCNMQVWRHRFRVCHPERGIIWVEGESSPERLTDGSVLWHGYNRDVTAQVRADERQAADRHRFRLMLELASDGVHVLNTDGNVVVCSKQFAVQLGYAPDEAIGMNVAEWDAMIPTDQLVDVVNEMIEHPRIFETLHRRKDGSVFPVEISGSALEFDGEKYYYASARDITPRKEAGRRIKQASARYRSVVNSTRDGYIVVDGQGRIVDCNAVFSRKFGYSREEVLQVTIKDIHRGETEESMAGRMAWIREQGGAQFDAEYLCKDGSPLPVEVSVGYSSHTPNEFFAFVRDTRARRIDRQLAELRAELATKVLDADEKALLRVAIDVAERITLSEIGFFHFFSEEDQVIDLSTWSTRTMNGGCGLRGVETHYPLREAGIWADAVRRRNPVIRNDHGNPDVGLALPERHAPLIRGLYCPVIRGDRVVAILGVGNKAVDYDEYDLSLVQQVGEIAYDYVERSFAEQKVQQMAFTDILTGLPNRRLLTDRLEQSIALARRAGTVVAVGYLDLDNFKPVNDTLGHECGDRLLVEYTRRLKKELRESDTLARFGGDEFVLLATQLETASAAEPIIRRVLEVSAEPFEIEGRKIELSASIGVAIFPDDHVQPDGLLRHADQAMYEAKNQGKNGYAFYSANARAGAQERKELLDAFERGIEASQLLLHFQPRIDLQSGALAGFEALVRWQHPDRGLLYPGDFLPILQGHLAQWALDRWVLAAALDAQERWDAAGLNVPVSVNLSSYSLQTVGFVAEIRKLLDRHQEASSGKLELEILEQSSIADTDAAAEVMQECIDLGIRFSLDDFGTGFSSLTYFHRLPIHIVKIDQSFVRKMLHDPRDQGIVEGVMGLAAATGLPVVGEGVESIELGLMLASQGCRYAQGYAIARPMPENRVLPWARAWHAEAEVWKGLSAYAAEPTPYYDLNVGIFSHRRWIDRVGHMLASPEIVDLGAPELQSFDQWWTGIGSARYGQRPEWAEVGAIRLDVTGRLNKQLESAQRGRCAEIDEETFSKVQRIESLLVSLARAE